MSALEIALSVIATSLVLLIAAFLFFASKKNMLGWLPGYVASMLRPVPAHAGTKHVMFCFVDHYEPRWGREVDMQTERQRVQAWVEGYPAMAEAFADSDGCHPKHTFFFPIDEYEPEHLEALRGICVQGLGEIEVHLHHDDDTAENLTTTLRDFAQEIHDRFGALSIDPLTGDLRYAFIHGNWVLDNSAHNGRWCGVNNELIVLRDTGCYADFTFPAAPHDSQPQQINSLYYATDDPDKPKSHNRGTPVAVGKAASGDLLLITGPLTLNWKNRKLGFMPRIENSDIRSSNPPTPDRVDAWVKTGIHVQGRPDWIFVKVHTHGAPEREAASLLGDPVKQMHAHLRDQYNDGEKYALHYVSAREMHNILKAAEAGHTGNPNEYRDFVLPRPHFHNPDNPVVSSD
ncbi:MAG: hypothetical protein AB8B57_04890 [Congregibacter sp.]